MKPGPAAKLHHIDDIVDALIKVGEVGEGDGFGIGSDDAWSIEQLAEMVDRWST